MRIVVDTNVLIDSKLDPFSASQRLLEAIEQHEITALMTPAIEREYKRLVPERIKDPALQTNLINLLKKIEVVQPHNVSIAIDDQEDKKFLAAAIGGRADFLVTGDQHLLSIGEVGRMRIVTPNECYRIWQNSRHGTDEWHAFIKGIGIGVVSFMIVLVNISSVHAQTPTPTSSPPALKQLEDNHQELQEKKETIAQLQQKIAELTQKKDQVDSQTAIITHNLERLQQELKQAELELKQTQLSMRLVQSEQKTLQTSINDLQVSIEKNRQQMREVVVLLYAKEHQSSWHTWLSSGTLSEALSQQQTLQELQERVVNLVNAMQLQSEELSKHQQELLAQEQSLGQLQGVLEVQGEEIAAKKATQEHFLAQRKEEQLAYETKIAEAKQARAEIEQQVFSLQKVGVELKLTDAVDMAKHAGSLTGVRPALILAVLKIETNVGTNLGSGHFPEDMRPDSREAFLRITKNLGLDPKTAPISARPTRYAGWGGAMGPGQFMPATWETIEGRLASLMGKEVVNPYDLTDAFAATALMLADRGGTTRSGEYEAVNRYLAGPNWRYVTWYGDKVLAVAEEYEHTGL